MNLLVFDSGIGGLGVVAEIRRLLPRAGLTYLADDEFYPYGEKPDDALLARILTVVGKGIAAARPNAVVIACNTASTVALGHLREAFALPFIGCVPPVKPAAVASRARHIGLLATAATIRRPYLTGLIEKFADGCTVYTHGTPVLADLAERKFRTGTLDPDAVAQAIAPLFARRGAEQIDAIALGCTHYTFLLPEFSALRPGIGWFDPAGPVARQTVAVTEKLRASPVGELAGTALFTGEAPGGALAARLTEFGFGKTRRLYVGPPGDAKSR